ncbi:cytochrome P450 [Penicillium lividum]|nr:cytochrome P450 [Penicillium lividum]
MADLEHIIYLAAMIKGVTRWRFTPPITVQLQLIEDLECGDSHFPKRIYFAFKGIGLSQQPDEPVRFDLSHWLGMGIREISPMGRVLWVDDASVLAQIDQQCDG